MKNKLVVLAFCLGFFGCKEEVLPKPKAMLRLEYPKSSYLQLQDDCPFTFEYNQDTKLNLNENAVRIADVLVFLPVNRGLSFVVKRFFIQDNAMIFQIIDGCLYWAFLIGFPLLRVQKNRRKRGLLFITLRPNFQNQFPSRLLRFCVEWMTNPHFVFTSISMNSNMLACSSGANTRKVTLERKINDLGDYVPNHENKRMNCPFLT